MKDRKELRERYDDALFALLMEAVVEEEGASALAEKERLKGVDEISIPIETTKRNLALINNSFTKVAAKRVSVGVGRVLRKVVLAAAICALLFTTAFASVPAFREVVYNYVIEVFDVGTKIGVDSVLNQPTERTANLDIDVGWLPEGYALIDRTTSVTSAWNTFGDEAGNQIAIDVYALVNGSVNVDTEDAEVQNIEINGIPALLILKEVDNQIVMMNEENGVICLLCSPTVSVTDLIRIAESINF